MTADLMKTRQILLNLLSNAAKFTRAGTITLDVQPSVLGGRPSIAFTVTDTGVGMTSEQASKVFDPFTQADVTTTRKYGGTGLGLALVSRFCRLMGGEVAVESQPTWDRDSSVRLPSDGVAEMAETPVLSARAPPRRRRSNDGNDHGGGRQRIEPRCALATARAARLPHRAGGRRRSRRSSSRARSGPTSS